MSLTTAATCSRRPPRVTREPPTRSRRAAPVPDTPWTLRMVETGHRPDRADRCVPQPVDVARPVTGGRDDAARVGDRAERPAAARDADGRRRAHRRRQARSPDRGPHGGARRGRGRPPGRRARGNAHRAEAVDRDDRAVEPGARTPRRASARASWPRPTRRSRSASGSGNSCCARSSPRRKTSASGSHASCTTKPARRSPRLASAWTWRSPHARPR